ncbi:uncharacterized protein LOC113763819 isoform X2 [Coffea eugenioides]|uniref:uncharacterized protein LOC113763819 isoform X2 n=1 Tax=Coffea eugenioides TaxID=49369 RepID=UPI000F5C5A94|nr:uncharacterized protein LOC113732590 isoform X2 [Coffea arabica]XP_027163567.1 uncharacterized protein LOC113763819 isoform X2 [Coffea eugenioides]
MEGEEEHNVERVSSIDSIPESGEATGESSAKRIRKQTSIAWDGFDTIAMTADGRKKVKCKWCAQTYLLKGNCQLWAMCGYSFLELNDERPFVRVFFHSFGTSIHCPCWIPLSKRGAVFGKLDRIHYHHNRPLPCDLGKRQGGNYISRWRNWKQEG